MNETNRVEVDEDYGGTSPLGSSRDGYVTYTEREDYLVDLIRGYIIAILLEEYLRGRS